MTKDQHPQFSANPARLGLDLDLAGLSNFYNSIEIRRATFGQTVFWKQIYWSPISCFLVQNEIFWIFFEFLEISKSVLESECQHILGEGQFSKNNFLFNAFWYKKGDFFISIWGVSFLREKIYWKQFYWFYWSSCVRFGSTTLFILWLWKGKIL